MTSSIKNAAPLALTLFGPMQASLRGQALPRLRSRKTQWLLALLALRHNRPVERDWLAGTLWPDSDQEQAFANLRPVLSDLRQVLGEESGRLLSPNRHTLQLNLADADVDVLAFDAAIADGGLSALERAAVLYRGPLLEGCAEEWVGQERAVREQGCLRALDILAHAALATGDHIRSAEYFRRSALLDPWSDVSRRGLMKALAHGGDSNAALQVYREFVELLRTDPKATPDEETRALYTHLRAEARRKMAGQTDTVAVRAAPPMVSGYLPHPLTNLIGREDERLEVAARLRRSRLVTLTGPGGIGKTRLAVAVAEDTVMEFPDGTWLVTLEALSDGAQVTRQIVGVLKLKEEAGRPLQDTLTEYLRPRRLLLVLDNCEHLLEASAQITGHLLRECAGVRVLATSREALGITGEAAWGVPALAVPDPAHLPTEQATLRRVVLAFESVQLFIERCQAIQRDFSLLGSRAAAVAQICAQLGGIPLAIELAAARTRALTVEQIAARLNDHLSLLTGGSRVALPRHQTLQATLDWSYALLSEAERVLLARLSVFAGGCDLEAVESVCAGEGISQGEVLNLLTGLLDKSLVALEKPDPEHHARYRLQETVRQYALKRLNASGASEKIRTRHRDYFMELSEEAAPELTGPEQGKWLDRLETEHDNLRAALTWSAEDPLGAAADLRMAVALGQFWLVRGHYKEGRDFLEKALNQEAPAATQVRVRALHSAGMLALNQSDFVSAQTLLEASLSICLQLGDKSGIARTTGSLGDIARNQGNLTAAKTQFEESLLLHRELKNKIGIAALLIKLGEMAYDQGQLAAARTLVEESLLLYRELGNKLGISNALCVLGNAASNQGNYILARTLLEESLLLRRELGNKHGIAAALNNMAKVASLQGDPLAASRQFEESLFLHRELGNKHGIAIATGNLGVVATNTGDYITARTQLEESLLLFRELGNKYGIAYTLVSLGDAVSRQGDDAVARTRLEEGLRLCRELADKQVIAYALSCLSRISSHQGDDTSARTQIAESLLLFQELGDRRGVALALEDFACALNAEAQNVQAARLLGAAQALRKSIGSPLSPTEQEQVDRQIARIRTVLNTAAFKEAWEVGGAMTMEQAVDYAPKE